MSDHEDSNGFRVFEASTASDLERQLNQWSDEWHKEPDRFLQVRRTQLAAGPGRLVALVNFNIKRRPKRAEVEAAKRDPIGKPEPYCGPDLWAQGRKCCPDCQHGPEGERAECIGCGAMGQAGKAPPKLHDYNEPHGKCPHGVAATAPGFCVMCPQCVAAIPPDPPKPFNCAQCGPSDFEHEPGSVYCKTAKAEEGARSGHCDKCGGKRWCPRCER